MEITKQKVATNLFWRFLERCGSQGISFIVSIILARLLEPEAFGILTIVVVVSNILQVFVDSGMSSALVQKKKADDTDFSTVFYFNIVFSVILYLLIYFAAPLVAKFYAMPKLTLYIRVLCLKLVLTSVKNVQQAYVTKNLQFKRFFFSTLGGTVVSAVVSIYMAYAGFGVWALIAQNLISAVVDTLILWCTVKWKPVAVFSLKKLKALFDFGWKILVQRLLTTIYANIRTLIIGKVYSSEELAYYHKGDTFPNIIMINIDSSIDSVILPTMVTAQDDRKNLKNIALRSIKISTYIMFPIMMGLAVCATPIVSVVLTDKWLPCVLYMRILCFVYALYPFNNANLNVLLSIGKSGLTLKLSVITKVIEMIVMFSTIWFGVDIFAYGILLSSLLTMIINAIPNQKSIHFGFLSQLKAVLPNILLSLFMGVCVYSVTFLNLNHVVTLCIQVPLGVLVYVLCSFLFKIDSYYYILEMIKGYTGKMVKKKAK